MTYYLLPLDNINKKVMLTNVTGTDAIVQLYDNGKKSRKSKAKIKYYNGNAYVMCCGHRYYLDSFIKCEL